MFTGIIEEVGKVARITHKPDSVFMEIEAKMILQGTQEGDSIALNGVCLTVTGLHPESYETEVMKESLMRTNLGGLRMGDKVNLERALTLSSRLGGHIVTGHIDGTGVIESMKQEGIATRIRILANEKVTGYMIEKGSVAVDGISLTVTEAGKKRFGVSVIPHTRKQTTLLEKKAGDTVNLECDMIGKYLEKFLTGKPERGITQGMLLENGF